MGKHTSLDNDEFDQAYSVLKTVHKNHSRHIASLFLITIMLTSVSLFAPIPASAAGETLSITQTPGSLIMDSTSTGETVVVTLTRNSGWSNHNVPLHIGTSAMGQGVTFTADGSALASAVTSGADNIQVTVNFEDSPYATTASFNLYVKTAATPFGNYMIFVDAVNINTGGDTIEAFPPPINLIVGDSSTPVLSLDPPDGAPGATNFKVNAFNFPSGATPALYLTDPENGKRAVTVSWTPSAVGNDGMISGTYTIPADVPAGFHELEFAAGGKVAINHLNVFVDGGSGGISASASPATLNLAPPPDTSLNSPPLTLGYDKFGSFSETAGVNFTISGMPPGMTAFWSTNDWSSNTAFATTAPVAANADSNISVKFKTTSSTPFGSYPISILAFDKTYKSIINKTASVTLSVPPPMAGEGESISGTLSLSPENAAVGDTVTFSGSIGAQFDGAKTITMTLGGSSLTTSPSTISAARSASSSTPTTFSGQFVVPSISGSQEVKATLTDDSSNTITLKKDLTVLAGSETYTASMSPANLPPQSPSTTSDAVTITVKGISGKPGATFDSMISGLPPGVCVVFPDEHPTNCSGGLSAPFNVASGGTVTKSFKLKADASAFPGPIMANVDVCDTTSWDCKYWTLNGGILSSGGFASVFLSETFVQPGDSLTVNANGFTGTETLNVVVGGNTVKTATASSGSATITLTIPANISPGFYPIDVVGQTSGKTAFSEINVFSTTGNDAKKFSVTVSPTTLSPIEQSSNPTDNTNMTITVKAFSGQSLTNDEATITIYGLPFGVTGGLESGSNKEPASYVQTPSITLDVATGSQNKTILSFKTDDFTMLGPFYASIDVASGSDYEFKDFSSSIISPTGSGAGGMMNFFEGLSEGAEGFAMKEMFSIGSVYVNPPSFLKTDTVTVTASGFTATDDVKVEIFGQSGHIDITPSGTPVFDSSGGWSGTVQIPNSGDIVPGYSLIEVSDESNRQAETDVTVLHDSAKFSLTASPSIIPPMSAGSTSDVTINVKALSGKDPGVVNLEFPAGLPYGLTACFSVDENGATVDCTNASNLESNPSSKLTPGMGGTSKTILTLKVDEYAQPGPVFIDLRAYTVAFGGSSTDFGTGDQEYFQFIDSNISPKSDFNSGFGAGGATNFFGSTGSFNDFGTMQTNFATQYGSDAFNAFTIAELFVSPTAGAVGDTVSLTATGFQPGENVEIVMFAGTNMTIPKSEKFNSQGSKTFTFKIPSGIGSGFHGVEVCSLTGMCAFSDFYVVSGTDVFNAFFTPPVLPPINGGEKTVQGTLTVKSFSGKDAGTVTMKVDYLPYGVQACFGNPCTDDNAFKDAPLSTTLTPEIGGTATTKIKYKTDSTVPPGPKWIDVLVTSSANTQQKIVFADFDVMGKQDFFNDSFQNMFSGGGEFAGGDFFNAYTIASLSLNPSSGQTGDQVTLTASGFSSGEEIESLIFAGKTLPIPDSANSTNTSGIFTTKLAVPTGLGAGLYPVDIVSESGMSAFADFIVIDSNSKFTISSSQQFLSPFSAGENSESVAITVKATKGNDPGTLTVKTPFLPPGITGCFNVDENKASVDCTNSANFEPSPVSTLTTGVGGSNKTTLTFKADEYAPPGPMFTMIEAFPTSGSMQSIPIDGSIGSKSNFGGFMTGTQNFMGDSSAGFVDFSTMQDNFAGTYGANSFNAFTIADLFVNPSAGAAGSSVTLSVNGFSPGVGIDKIMFGWKNIPVPSGTVADSSGAFSTTIAVPSGLSGFQPIDVCTTNGVCAFADFKISSATDNFILTASPSFLEPVHAGEKTTNSTLTIKAMKGKNPGTVTLSIDMIPWGVQARFNGTDGGSFSSYPSYTVTPGLGGAVSLPIDYQISETAPPGPVWVDVRVESSTQSQVLFLDTAVMPKNDFFQAGFTDMFASGGAMDGQFNAFTVASLVISPSSAAAGDQITLTASGFNSGAKVDNLYFGPKTLPLPSGSDTFSSSGVLTTKLAVPTGLDSGHYPIDICATDGMCAFTDFYVASSSDLFTVDAAPQFLPPISALNYSINYDTASSGDYNPNNYMSMGTPPWITQNSTLSVKAMSGKDAGDVTLSVEYLPPGVTARFNKTLANGNPTPWLSNPQFILEVGTGGKNSTNIMFMAGNSSFPGPLYADVMAYTDKSDQSLFIPIDSAIMPQADFFDPGFTNEFGAGGDFDGMENLFKIASMSITPSNGAAGDSITISGSGFTPSAGIDLLRIGSQNIAMPSGTSFDSSGFYSVSLAIPSLSSGHWDVELCDTNFICSFSEIFVTGSDDLFTVTANPQYLEAAFPGVKTNSTKITVNALSGSNAGNVTLSAFGLPPGIWSFFDGVNKTSTVLEVGTGGTNSTTLQFDIGSKAFSGPVFVDIEATSDKGSQTFLIPIDFGVLPKSGLAFFDNTFKTNYNGFFPFKVGMVTLSSTAGSVNSSLTLSASGFAPNSVVDELIFGNHTVALPTSQKAFDSSGSKKLTFKVPHKIESGIHPVDLCTTDFMCAGDEFFVTSSSDLFKLSASPEELPPANQGGNSESIIITAEALSGKNAGTVTLALSGLPSGVTSQFDGTASTTKDLVIGYGGKASTSLVFAIADTVSPGPVFFDVTATTSAGSQVFSGTFDFGVMPNFEQGGTIDTFVDAIPVGDFNPFDFGSLIVSPTAESINGTVKLTASGFTPNANINGPNIIFGNHTLALLSADSKFSSDGVYSTSIAVPNMVDGNYNVQICESGGKCADASFEMISSAKTFSLDISPQKMPPALQGQVIADSDTLSISLKAFKGKTPGVVTVELFGLPDGVNSYLDINDGNGFVIRTSAPITLGLGDSQTIKAKFVVDEYAAPNAIPIFVEATDSTGTEIKGKSVSFGVIPKATFAASLGVGNLVVEPVNNATQNTVTVTASGFTANDPITIFWGIDHDCSDAHCDIVDLPSGTSFDANGFYSQTISVKNVTSLGVFPITIMDNSQRIVTEEFEVVKAGLKFSNKISENSLAPVSRGDETANSTLTIESLAGQDSDAVEVSFIGLPDGFTPILDGTPLQNTDTVSAEGGTALGKSFNPALGNLNKTNIAFDTTSTTVPGTYHITVNVTDANQITTLHDLEINVKPSGDAADDFAQLSLSKASGIENSTLTIAGKGFTAAGTVTLEFGTSDFSLPPNTVFDSSGTFSTTIKIPGVVAGDYPITLSDGTRSATEIFTILGTSDKYSISVSPSNLLIPPLTIGTDSSPLKFSISSASGINAAAVTFNVNYTSHPGIQLKWNSSGTISDTNRIDPGFGQTVSSQLVLNAPTGIDEGNGNVVINLDVSDGINTKYYSLETSIIPAAGNLATCTIAPSKTSAGSAVTVYGSGFSTSSTVSIDPLKMAGTSSELSFGETITTDGSGVFSSQFTVPATINSIALEGAYEFHISDASGKSCHADIFVIPDNPVIQTSVDSQSMITEVGGHINATLSVTSQNELSGDLELMMTSLPPGVTANVTSTNGTIIANYHGKVSGTVSDPIADKEGIFAFTPGSPQLFNVTFNIPDNLKPGPYSIKLGANSTDQVRAESLTLQITDKGKSGVSTFPSDGLTESQVSVEGSGFGPTETITLKFDGLSSGTSGFTVSPGTITTTSVGNFNGTITIPTLDAGLYGLFAKGSSSLKNSTSQFTIIPNESTFALEISPKQINLKQGESGTYDIALVPMGGFSSNVTLSLTGIPDGITSSLQPTTEIDPLNGIASPVTLTISVPVTKSVSSYTFSIVGTADNGAVVTERANIKIQQKTGGNMGNPLDMEKNSDGHLLIIDAENCQVQKFGENGTFIDAYGSCGTGDLEFDFEHGSGDPDGGIDIDSDGNIYIADTGNDRVVKLDSDGVFVKTIGTTGTGDGEFTTPVAIEIDSNDNLWVTDEGDGGKIVKYNTEGVYGSLEINNDLTTPASVASNSTHLVVVDTDDDEVKTYKISDGNAAPATTFGGNGSSTGQLFNPVDVEIDSSGNIFVVEEGNDRIQKFDDTGSYKALIENGTSATFDKPSAILLDNDGNMHIANTNNNTLAKMDANELVAGTGPLKSNSTLPAGKTAIGTVAYTSTNSSGYVLTTDTENDRVKIYDDRGNAVDEVAINSPVGIAQNSTGHIFVAQNATNTIKILNPDGSDPGVELGSELNFANLEGLTIDSSDNIVVVDKGDDNRGAEIVKISQDETVLLNVTGFTAPRDVAIDTSGNIYATEANSGNVTKLDSTGTQIWSIGGNGTADGKFTEPSGIDIDASGNVYIADSGNDRLQKIDSDGEFLNKFDASDGDGLSSPTGIAIKDDGTIIVAESTGDEIEEIQTTANFETSYGNGTYGDFTVEAGPKEVVLPDTTTNSTVFEIKIQTDGVDKTKAIYVDFDVPTGIKLNNAASGNSTALSTGNQLKLTIDSDTGLATGNITIARNSTLSEGLSTLTMKTMVENVDPISNSGIISNHKNTTLNIIGTSSTTTIESDTSSPVAPASITGTTPLQISTDLGGDTIKIAMKELTTDTGDPVTIETKKLVMDHSSLSSEESFSSGFEHIAGASIINIESSSKAATTNYDIKIPIPGSLPDGMTENELKITWFDDANGDWVEVDSTVSDGYVIGTVDHFSSFSLGGSVGSSSSSSSSGVGSAGGAGGGGGGGGTGGDAPTGTGSDTFGSLIIYEISYDACVDEEVRVTIGSDTSDIDVKLRSPIMGVTHGVLGEELFNYSAVPNQNVYVFVAPLNPDEDYVRVEVDSLSGRTGSHAVKSLNIYGCEGSEIVNIPSVFTQPTPSDAKPEKTSFKSTPLDGGNFVTSTYDKYDFNVWYLLNGDISSVTVDVDNSMIGLDLDDYTDGSITLSLSRSIIDSDNDNFVIMTYPENISDYEIIESTESNVIVQLTPPTGTERIEIFGSTVVPEFGNIALFILIISIISLTVLFRQQSFKKLSI